MISRMFDFLYKLLGNLPSTNTRIAVTLFIALVTTARYLASGLPIPGGAVQAWEPSYEWLGFIVLMSGLDVAQFHTKRKTNTPPSGPDAEDAGAKKGNITETK